MKFEAQARLYRSGSATQLLCVGVPQGKSRRCTPNEKRQEKVLFTTVHDSGSHPALKQHHSYHSLPECVLQLITCENELTIRLNL